MKNNFLYSCSSNIDNQILDSLTSPENIASVSLSIKASHAGKVNGNFVFYTPRGMKKGVTTLVSPFKKHLQNLHKGDAVGVINDAFYLDYTANYSPTVQRIASDIENATTPLGLVTSIKELLKQPDYKNSGFKGLGVVQVSADLYDSTLILELANGTNKGKVSIGGNSKRVYCSVCAELFTRDHEHQRGRSYGGETCFAVYDTMELDHIGFVPDPADTATETVIISDSIEETFSSVTIEDFKIQDNIKGHIMNIEQLKQFASDVNNLVNITGLTDKQKVSLTESYANGKKHARSSGYLLSEEKLLPVTTKETTALTFKAISQLEDSAEKQALLDLLAPHLAKHFDVEDVDTFLANFALDEVESAMTDDTKAIVAEEQGKVDATNAAQAEEVEAASKADFDLSAETIEKLVARTVEVTLASLKPAEEKTGIQDSVEYGLIVNYNKQLASDIEALDLANAELTKRCKDAIISQILAHKSVKKDSAYAERLAERDLDSLSTTLQDIEFELSYKETETLTATTEETQEDNASTEDNVTQEVQDSLNEDDPANTPDQETSELETVELKDSLTNLNVDDQAEVKDNVSDLDIIKREGLASYLRKIKTK